MEDLDLEKCTLSQLMSRVEVHKSNTYPNQRTAQTKSAVSWDSQVYQAQDTSASDTQNTQPTFTKEAVEQLLYAMQDRSRPRTKDKRYSKSHKHQHNSRSSSRDGSKSRDNSKHRHNSKGRSSSYDKRNHSKDRKNRSNSSDKYSSKSSYGNHTNRDRSSSRDGKRHPTPGPKSDKDCYHCGKPGHFFRDCDTLYEEMKQKKNTHF